MNIVTDIDLCLWLSTQQSSYVKSFAELCEREAEKSDDPSDPYDVYAGTARALLNGEDPLYVQRWLASATPGYYEEDGGTS